MKLINFRVRNFRSVSDSGEIRVDDGVTSLVGRNESGKSNLLLALSSLNPVEGFKELSPIKDFPRDRRLQECIDATEVLESNWQLSEEEKGKLIEMLPSASKVTTVRVGRRYKSRWVDIKVARPEPDKTAIKAALRKVEPIITVSIEVLTSEHQTAVLAAWSAFKTTAENLPSLWFTDKWPEKVTSTSQALSAAFVRAGVTLPDAADEALNPILEKAEEIVDFEKAYVSAKAKIVEWLPKFIYVAEFPDLSGHQNIEKYSARRSTGEILSEAEQNFEKLMKVAGLNAKQLQTLGSDHETRNQLVNRAGAYVTKEIRRLWKDRDLKVRFNIDGAHLETLISDPNTTYDVEVNLDERSRGFRWFFSFYMTFAADTDGGTAEGAILLLDEPGLYLHATSQTDLLKHLREDFENQIIFTTHSPFMVPSDAIDKVRTVNITQHKGTSVSNDPTGDSRTLFPLQAALGYHASQTLFIGNSNLVVEGVTDFWFLSAVSEYLREQEGDSLPSELIFTPAGGAKRVAYMATLLASQRLDVLILLDDEPTGREAKHEIVTSKLVRDHNIILVSEGFPEGTVTEADIEDLIDPAVYEALIRESYKAELRGKTLSLNTKIPRIVKRFEEAFTALGLTFNKTRPARLFAKYMASDPQKMLPETSKARFKKLFEIITTRLQKHQASGRQQFE